ncbi:MAG: leucine-rich repeat protein [Clostridia bacterium]|nr:leucine-rich repeat protein [Clostridia bacterium]
MNKTKLFILLLVSVLLVSAVIIVGSNSVDSADNSLKIDDISSIFTGDDNALADEINAERALTTLSDDTEVDVIIEIDGESLIDKFLEQTYYKELIDYSVSQDWCVQKLLLNDKLDAIKSKLIAEGVEIKFSHTYTTLICGMSASMRYGDVKSIEGFEGIKSVAVSEEYEEASSDVDVFSLMQNSGIFENNTEYTGDGMVVAVLDTGLDYSHTAFSSQIVNGAFSSNSINDIIATYSLGGRYMTSKIVYTYDFADQDDDVYPTNTHGTHVAGIISGYDEVISGVVPNAQLAIMKIFADGSSGASTANIIAGLEECAILGVDVVNMSLGTPAGFSTERSDSMLFVNECYDRLERLGTIIIASVGNEANSSYNCKTGSNLTSNPEINLLGSPSTYSATMGVASIDTTGIPYLLVNGVNKIKFNESVDASSEFRSFISDMLNGESSKNFEYVYVNGYGVESDYENLDVSGKIAVVIRGSGSFEDKQSIAFEKGAIGCIVVNNSITAVNMSIAELKIPTVLVSMEDGKAFANQPNGTLGVSTEFIAAPSMSIFSSWGPNSDLTIKPEITGFGGEIYSSVIGGHDYMSGTSMAAPNISGVAVAVKQYAKQRLPYYTDKQLQALVYQLIMSTAQIAYDLNGNPYFVRNQGAGIASIENAVSTDAYLSVVGSNKAKIELGDDKEKDGIYTLSFRLVNMSDKTLEYQIGSLTFTESVNPDNITVSHIAHMLSGGNVNISVSGGEYDKNTDTLTVSEHGVASIRMQIVLSDEEKEYLDSSFDNGQYIEGFAVLTSLNDGIDLSIPWLAFYGDWNAVPAFDATIYDEALSQIVNSRLEGAYGGRTVILGSYMFELAEGVQEPTASKDKIAIGYDSKSISGISNIVTGLLRNLAYMGYSVVDTTTEEELFYGYGVNVMKSFYYSGQGSIVYLSHGITFYTRDYDLKNNQRIELTIEGLVDYYGAEYQYLTYPITIDFEAPTLIEAEYKEEDGRSIINMNIFDNHYLQALSLFTKNDNGEYIPVSDYALPIYDWMPNSDNSYRLDITDYLASGSIMNDTLVVRFTDYAMNASEFELSLVGVTYTKPQLEIDEEDTSDIEFVIENGVLVEYNGIGGKVVIPDNVTAIADVANSTYGVFYQSGVTEVVLPEGLISIGAYAFNSCSELESVVFPSTLESAGNACFANCSMLTSVDLSNTKLTSIATYMFSSDINLTKVVLPLGVTNIEAHAFSSDTALVDINIEELTQLTTLQSAVFMSSGIKGIVLPSSVNEIGASVFSGCTKLLTADLSKASISSIPGDAFYNCLAMETIELPNELKAIGFRAFQSCLALRDLVLPKTLLTIDSNAFYHCESITEIVFPESLLQFGSSQYGNTSIVSYCNSLRKVEILSKNITVIPSNFVYGSPLVTEIVIAGEYTSIGAQAFRGTGISEFVIPDSVVSIGNSAFRDNLNLVGIEIPDSVTTLGTYVFTGCTSL